MALPFLNGHARTKDGLISIDLGGRTTKAIELKKAGDSYVLKSYAVVDAPAYDKDTTAEALGAHLKAVCQALDPKAKAVALALDVNNSIVRYAEMPLMPVGDMRQILKGNSKAYLQQELPDHVFDCFITAPKATQKPQEKPAGLSGMPKMRVLVAGARKELLAGSHTAVKNAGYVPESIVPGMVAMVNAFEMAMPEVFAKECVALVDIGFRSSSICLLQEGELVLNRVVAIGGDTITNGLAETMGISYAEAEGIKVGIPAEVQSSLEPLILPLGRELRASIDCFEHQQDRTVSQVFVSGASARSEFILQTLQAELMLECKLWNPVSFMSLSLRPEQAAEIEQIAPQLSVAVGAALATC